MADEHRGLMRLFVLIIVIALVALGTMMWSAMRTASEPEVTTSPPVKLTEKPTKPPAVPPGLGIRVVPQEFYLDGRLVRFGEIFYAGELARRPWAVAFHLPKGTVLRTPFAGELYVSGFDPIYTNIIWERDRIINGSVYEGGYGFKKGLVIFAMGLALQFPAGRGEPGPVQGEWIARGEVLVVVARPARGLPIPGLEDYNVLLEFNVWTGPSFGELSAYDGGPKLVRQFFPYLFSQEEG